MTIDAFDWMHRTGANPPDDSTTRRTWPARSRSAAPFGAARPHLRGHLRPRVPAPAGVLRGPGRGELGQRGPLGLGPDASSATSTRSPTRPTRPLTATSVLLPRLPRRDVRRPGEVADPWEDQGGHRDPCRLRRGVLVHEVSLRPLRRRLHDGAAHRGRQRPGRPAEGAGPVRLEEVGAWTSSTTGRRRWRWTPRSTSGRKLTGGRAADFTAKSLSSSINWGNTQAYDSPGAPPNGSDYVRLREAAGRQR